MAHTPGPWRAFELAHTQEPDHTYWHIQSTAEDYAAPAIDLSAYMSADDAHLIAAAPDLLAALKDLVERTEQFADLADALTAARAAITRAEGRT